MKKVYTNITEYVKKVVLEGINENVIINYNYNVEEVSRIINKFADKNDIQIDILYGVLGPINPPLSKSGKGYALPDLLNCKAINLTPKPATIRTDISKTLLYQNNVKMVDNIINKEIHNNLACVVLNEIKPEPFQSGDTYIVAYFGETIDIEIQKYEEEKFITLLAYCDYDVAKKE